MEENIYRGLSVVLPAFNEEESIGRCVEDISKHLKSLPFRSFEVIVVDDGSTDSTPRIVDELAQTNPQLRVIHHSENLGYAVALRDGFAAASQPLIFYTDSDNQFDIRELGLLLDLIGDNDIVTGFRVYRFDPLTRLFLSWGFNLLVRIIFRIKVKDIDCAFKLFKREALENIHIESRRFFVDAEILAKARYLGYRMVEVPVRHYPRQAGRSTVRPSHIPWTLFELAKMWVRIYLQKKI